MDDEDEEYEEEEDLSPSERWDFIFEDDQEGEDFPYHWRGSGKPPKRSKSKR